jgi:hypothetical protein
MPPLPSFPTVKLPPTSLTSMPPELSSSIVTSR